MNKEQLNDSLKNSDKNFNKNCTHNKKQIIIDGVNVSECNFLLDVEGICTSDSYYCEGHTNCYFKQLARKTQECEQKDKELLSNEKIINKLMKEVDELRQECEELKEKYEEVKEDRYNLNMEMYTLYRYRKALEEIEKKVNKKTETSICSECAYNHLPECKDNCMQDALENILDIINKAKGEGNEDT